MTDRLLRVFVNATSVDVPAGSHAIDAVRAWGGDIAAQVEAGTRQITDSRGLPLDGSAPVSAGSILRVVAVRERNPAAGDADE